MHHHPPPLVSARHGAVRLVLGAAWVVLMAGCGGNDDEAPAPTPVTPVTNNSLSAQQIGTAQAAVEPTIVVVDAGTAALTSTQIESRRAALDGSTTDGAATIVSNQTALDAAADVTPAF